MRNNFTFKLQHKELKNLLLFIFSFATISSGFAQTRLNLEQSIAYALENNLSIKQAKFSESIAEADFMQSKLSLLPSLNGSASQGYNFGRNIDPQTNLFVNDQINSNSFSLSSNVTLFAGFQRINSIAQARFNLLANKSNLDRIKNEVQLNVISLFLQILYNQDLTINSNAQLLISKQQLDNAQKRFDAGALTVGDLTTFRAQVSVDEFNLINIQNQLDIALLNLKQILNFPINDELVLTQPATIAIDKIETDFNTTAVYEDALLINPEIKLSEFRRRAAQKAWAIAKGADAPRIFLGGNLASGFSSGRKRIVSVQQNGFEVIGVTQNTNENVLAPRFQASLETTPFKDQISENFNQSLNITLQVPIFNGWQTRASVRRARINYQSSLLDEEIAKSNLSIAVSQAVFDLKAAEKRLLSAQSSFESLKQAYEFSLQRFEIGLINALDLNIAKNNMVRAETDALQAKYDLIFKSKVIDYYLGKPITF